MFGSFVGVRECEFPGLPEIVGVAVAIRPPPRRVLARPNGDSAPQPPFPAPPIREPATLDTVKGDSGCHGVKDALAALRRRCFSLVACCNNTTVICLVTQ